MIDYAEISRRLMDNKKVNKSHLRAYFSRRHINPVIKWQWEALTWVTPAGNGSRFGIIHFPDGTDQQFETTRIL